MCFLGRDFGPMLTAERASCPNLELPFDASASIRSNNEDKGQSTANKKNMKGENLELQAGSIQEDKQGDDLMAGVCVCVCVCVCV